MDSIHKEKIILAGREFHLACLPFAKNRLVVPAVSFALKAMERMAPPISEPLNLTAMDNIYLAVYEAVNYADPKVTREDFNKWEMTVHELCLALKSVAMQTGVLVPAKPGDVVGEGEARK